MCRESKEISMKKDVQAMLLICFFISSKCVHKEINIKEIYFKKESFTSLKGSSQKFESIEKCSILNDNSFIENRRYKQDGDEIAEILEEAFKRNKGKSLYNVEISRNGHSCTSYKGQNVE